MERTAWTDERLDDLSGEVRELRREMRSEFADVRAEMRGEFAGVRADIRGMRFELFQLKLFLMGGLVTILATLVALH